MLPNPVLGHIPAGKIMSQEEWIPLVPGSHAGPDAQKDFARGMVDINQRPGAMPYVPGQICVQPDTHGFSKRPFTLIVEIHLARDDAATAVGAYDILGADRVLRTCPSVTNLRIDT